MLLCFWFGFCLCCFLVLHASDAGYPRFSLYPKEEKKAAAAKKAEPKVSAVIQCSAGQVTVEDLTAAAARAYKEAHEGAEIENITIYIKPEENAVYYVVNGDDSEGNNKLALI